MDSSAFNLSMDANNILQRSKNLIQSLRAMVATGNS